MRLPRTLTAAALIAGASCAPELAPPTFADSVTEPGLGDKLERQWRHFDHARELLAERGNRLPVLPHPGLSRSEWERVLTPDPAYRITPAELDDLRASQQTRIELARNLTCDRSSLDLDAVRASGRVADFARELPKGGLLHIHPTGTLAPETVARILEEADPRIRIGEWREALLHQDDASLYPDELRFLDAYPDPVHFSQLDPEDRRRLAGLFHLPPGRHSFERFGAVFRLVSLVQAGTDAFPSDRIYEDLFRRTREQGVIYLELTQGFEPDPEALTEWSRIIRMAEDRFDLVVRVNLAFDRARSPARNRRRLHRLIDREAQGIVGIDLVGAEGEHPALERGEAVYASWLAARARGRTELQATIHAAGLGEPRNVRDALIFGTDRIGHAVGLIDDPVALEYGARSAVAIEANLTSNVRLGYVESYEDHPFLDLLRLGYRVSLSTDDEGILETDISREFERAILHSDVCYEEVRRMSYNSIDAGFVDSALRELLRNRLDAAFETFEADWTPVAGSPPEA